MGKSEDKGSKTIKEGLKHTVQFIKKLNVLCFQYVRTYGYRFVFFSKDQLYYKVSGSVLTLRTYVQVNKKRMVRTCAPLYIVNKENIGTNG